MYPVADVVKGSPPAELAADGRGSWQQQHQHQSKSVTIALDIPLRVVFQVPPGCRQGSDAQWNSSTSTTTTSSWSSRDSSVRLATASVTSSSGTGSSNCRRLDVDSVKSSSSSSTAAAVQRHQHLLPVSSRPTSASVDNSSRSTGDRAGDDGHWSAEVSETTSKMTSSTHYDDSTDRDDDGDDDFDAVDPTTVATLSRAAAADDDAELRQHRNSSQPARGEFVERRRIETATNCGDGHQDCCRTSDFTAVDQRGVADVRRREERTVCCGTPDVVDRTDSGNVKVCPTISIQPAPNDVDGFDNGCCGCCDDGSGSVNLAMTSSCDDVVFDDDEDVGLGEDFGLELLSDGGSAMDAVRALADRLGLPVTMTSKRLQSGAVSTLSAIDESDSSWRAQHRAEDIAVVDRTRSTADDTNKLTNILDDLVC